MEIRGLNVDVSVDLSGRLATTRALLGRPRSAVRRVAEQARSSLAELTDLLFGVEMSLEDVREYRNHLLRAIDLADWLEQDEQLPDPRRRRGSGGGFVHLGPVQWHQTTLPAAGLKVPVEQSEMARRIFDLQSLCRLCGLSQSPGFPCTACGLEARDVVCRTAFTAARGLHEITCGADRVELGRDSLAHLLAPQDPVVHTRMPPRFPRYGEIIALTAQS